jgi:hypothetical protein
MFDAQFVLQPRLFFSQGTEWKLNNFCSHYAYFAENMAIRQPWQQYGYSLTPEGIAQGDLSDLTPEYVCLTVKVLMAISI